METGLPQSIDIFVVVSRQHKTTWPLNCQKKNKWEGQFYESNSSFVLTSELFFQAGSALTS